MRRRIFLGLTAVAGLAGGVACAQGRSSVAAVPTPFAVGPSMVYRDVAYADPVGRAHLLDLYVPASASGPVPVVIHHVGSAWMSDDTKGTPRPTATIPTGMITAPELAARWTPHGYAVVGLNVRNSSQAAFPAQVDDARTAIDFLTANADTFGLDPDRFALMGNSSGGWLAAMTGLTANGAVKAVIDLYGPTDFLRMDAHRLADGMIHDAADSPESQLMGFPIQTDSSAVAAANPANLVTADGPAAYIVHGEQDPLVPAHQSRILFDAYAAAGATATLTLVPDTGHTDSYLSDSAASTGRTVMTTRDGRTSTATEPAPTFATLLAFLDAHLNT